MDLAKDFPHILAIQKDIESKLYTGSMEQRLAAHQELAKWSSGDMPANWLPDIFEDRGELFVAEHRETFEGNHSVIALGFAKTDDTPDEVLEASKLGLRMSVWQLRELHRLEVRAKAVKS